MNYVRIRSYRNSKFTGCEHLYLGDNQVQALERFRKEYPEHNDCIIVAETIDSDEESELVKACRRCGCIH